MLYLYVLLILISETIAFSLLKKFSINEHWLYFGFGVFFYSLVAFFLVKSFKHGDMGVVNALWSAFSVLAAIAVGSLYFKETITGAEIGGMLLIILGVAVLKAVSA